MDLRDQGHYFILLDKNPMKYNFILINNTYQVSRGIYVRKKISKDEDENGLFRITRHLEM